MQKNVINETQQFLELIYTTKRKEKIMSCPQTQSWKVVSQSVSGDFIMDQINQPFKKLTKGLQ